MSDIARVLQSHSLFSALPFEALEQLVSSAELLRLSKGARLYTQNAPADSAFLVLSGHVDLLNEISDLNGGQTIGQGAILSQLALLTQTVRQTSAYARSNLEVLQINRTQFRRVLNEHPHAMLKIREFMLASLSLAELERRDVIEALEQGL